MYAAVIAFDVAVSSQIKHTIAKDFLHNVIKPCKLEMGANYNSNTMNSDAYRVKEMGDGVFSPLAFLLKHKHSQTPRKGHENFQAVL